MGPEVCGNNAHGDGAFDAVKVASVIVDAVTTAIADPVNEAAGTAASDPVFSESRLSDIGVSATADLSSIYAAPATSTRYHPFTCRLQPLMMDDQRFDLACKHLLWHIC
jgi:hypothetical protein